MVIPIQKLNERARLPERGTAYSAGYDLYADEDLEKVGIFPGGSRKIKTGIAVAIPEGYFGAIFARSGLASKQGLRPSNCVGVIDSDYRGEVIVSLHNDSDQIRYIHDGDRIAQLVVMPYITAEFMVVSELDETKRGSGGFGSTGISDAKERPELDGQMSFMQ